ncbi:MAG TPA: hypothetical protein VJH24_05700 [Candidatus Bilamarchaeaceae archaeon]|nr:hypothetical protein [Candidatus Bilamarchaeaceae archaeon]
MLERNQNIGLLELVRQLEEHAQQSQTSSLDPDALETATKLRDLVVRDVSGIGYDGKIRLVKLVNRLKVRALLRDDEEGYRMFSRLESIGSDILRVF